jgi:hypothetical protein
MFKRVKAREVSACCRAVEVLCSVFLVCVPLPIHLPWLLVKPCS